MSQVVSECEHGEPRGPQRCALCRRAGNVLKEEGQSRALEFANGDWHERARRALQYLAHLDEPFTSEDLIARAGLPSGAKGTNANNAVGALLSSWARAGRIERVGYTQSARPSSHSAVIALWQGCK